MRGGVPGNKLTFAEPEAEDSTPQAGLVGELDRLVDLYQQGFLSDEEFSAAKRRLLQTHPSVEIPNS